MPLLAALALTSCSEADGPEVPGNQGNDLGYVAVNILQSKDAKARATDDDFENGSDDENYAQTGLFFVFNAGGTQKRGEAQTLALTPATPSTGNPHVEKIYNAVLVIDGYKGSKPTDANQIVCVLNAPAGLANVTTLAQLQQEVANYAASGKGTFIMTNSVYKDGASEIVGAIVNDSDIYNSPSEALNAPVEIYVERVVAKIKAESKNFKNNGAEASIDGNKTEFDIDITGIEIANIATTSYLFKNMTGINASWSWVNDPANKRSYWETVPSPLAYANQSYNQITTPDFDINNVDLTQYVQPNTSAQKTSVLVTAQLKLKGQEGEAAKTDFVYVNGGYFSANGALKLIAQHVANNGYWKKTADEPATYEQLDADDFEWKTDADFATAPEGLKDYQVVAQVKSTVGNIYTKDSEGNYIASSAAAVNDFLIEATNYFAGYYKNGLCYYFVEIDQSPVSGEKAGTRLGVVRNHVYKLTLNSIGGIGTPVFDPDKIIIPDRPTDDELWYLSARINVLAWRLVSQTVDFEGL